MTANKDLFAGPPVGVHSFQLKFLYPLTPHVHTRAATVSLSHTPLLKQFNCVSKASHAPQSCPYSAVSALDFGQKHDALSYVYLMAQTAKSRRRHPGPRSRGRVRRRRSLVGQNSDLCTM